MNKILSQTNMIKQQLRTGNVFDNTILDLFQNIERNVFVPFAYRGFAYSDLQIPLAHQQRMLTPLEEALILQTLNLQGHETVLEIGTGSGFFTALLSHLVQKVISVDCFSDFTAQAKKHCQTIAQDNIEFVTGDGHNGWVNQAPYDVIILTGGISALTELLKLQLSLGGKLFAITGNRPVMTGYVYQVDHQNHWTKTVLFETDVPLLIDNCRHQPFVF